MNDPRGPLHTECYHCGLPVPVGSAFVVDIDHTLREMCCAGCQAVAQAIVGNGLSDYYRHRDALPNSPREALPEALQDLGLFDQPDIQRSFVRPSGEHEREASLILEGITCAACVWLNEQHLMRQPGVTAVEINYATRRARVRWDERCGKLSAILAAVAAIGYHAYPYDAQRSEQLAQRERRSAIWRLFVAGFGMMQVMMYAVPVYVAEAGTMTADIGALMRWASMVLTFPVVFYSSAPFFLNAWRDLRLRRIGMDVPVALGVGSAFAASVWATLRGTGEVYFDSVTMFVFLLLCGRYLEMVARQKAVRGIEEVGRALPAFAERLTAYPALECERVAVATLRSGDLVLVRPGQTVPADGQVEQGESAADESLLSGESRPVPKRTGDPVTGGSVNGPSPLVVRIDKVGVETRMASIVRLMERAMSEKPRIVEVADRTAHYFVLALIVVAAATGIAWSQIDPDRALWIFVSVLVVTCPCALSLATPVALAVATGSLSRLGLLVSRGHAVETLARATHFVFDKTGTLTEGRLRLVDIRPAGCDQDECLRLAATLEQGAEHSVARAILGACSAGGFPEVRQLRAVTGQGVEGWVAGRLARIGRPEFVAELSGVRLPADVAGAMAAGDTWVALGDTRGWLGFLRFGDTLRAQTAEALEALRQSGARVSIVSGDLSSAVAEVARALQVADAHGDMTPEGKHAYISGLQSGGAIVAMVGDGVNDAPVLAQAQVSLAMGSGTELARNHADVVLLGERLAALAQGVALARRTLSIIRQNLRWAFAYNFLALPLAVAGYVTPWMAGIGMSASSLLVVLNALRLQARPKAR